MTESSDRVRGSIRWAIFGLLTVAGLAIAVAPMSAKASESIEPVPAKFRFTFEDVSLPANEKMGLLGTTLLFDTNDWLSLGVGAYGALSGQRGGFITLGGAAEASLPLHEYVEIASGVFVGAGGGHSGYTLSGGGLMLRFHAGARVKTMLGDFGAGISYLDFPDGAIHSSQPYFSYEYPFYTILDSGWRELPPRSAGFMTASRMGEQELAPVYRHYIIPAGVLTDAGTPQHRYIDLMGIEWNRYIDDNWFIHVETEGAMRGKSNGYMQILFGGGFRYKLFDGTRLKLSSSVGVAGGGNVATGGGFIVDAVASLQQRLGEHLYAEFSGGFVRVPSTSFKATSIAGKLGYHFFTPDASDDNPREVAELSGFEAEHFRLRFGGQHYFKGAADWRTHHANLDVDLLGVQADWFVHPNIYLTGQGLAAATGMAGAYMTGLFGAGVHLPLFDLPLFIDAEGLAGAAGGGGMAVGGGLVWQTNAGFGYQFSDALAAIAQFGYIAAPRGTFRAKVATVSLAYSFSLFMK